MSTLAREMRLMHGANALSAAVRRSMRWCTPNDTETQVAISGKCMRSPRLLQADLRCFVQKNNRGRSEQAHRRVSVARIHSGKQTVYSAVSN